MWIKVHFAERSLTIFQTTLFKAVADFRRFLNYWMRQSFFTVAYLHSEVYTHARAHACAHARAHARTHTCTLCVGGRLETRRHTHTRSHCESVQTASRDLQSVTGLHVGFVGWLWGFQERSRRQREEERWGKGVANTFKC